MQEFYYISIPLVIGFLLDSLLGDPRGLPHPIRWFGCNISFLEKKLNKGRWLKLKGGFMTVVLVGFWYIIFYSLIKSIESTEGVYYAISSILVFYGLANRNLIEEALKVERKLNSEGLEAGRKQLSYIVGRDTQKLSENKIRVAVLETLSENLSDGVIAPLFYYAIGGIPLMLAYKMVNTLDSMIGYKNDRYKSFGYFAAKLDDIANYIPARITAFLMVLICFSRRGFVFIFKYGNKHASPNAGYPEAALAGILDCQFGGPNIYHGEVLKKPFIGNTERTITTKDLYKTAVINFATALVFIILIIGFHFLFR